eukprot:70660-Alexandrium_andersonii.AAC.1
MFVLSSVALRGRQAPGPLQRRSARGACRLGRWVARPVRAARLAARARPAMWGQPTRARAVRTPQIDR